MSEMQIEAQPLRRRLIMAGRLHQSVPRKPTSQMMIDALQETIRLGKVAIQIQAERIAVQAETIELQGATIGAQQEEIDLTLESNQLLLEQIDLLQQMQNISSIDEDFENPPCCAPIKIEPKDGRKH